MADGRDVACWTNHAMEQLRDNKLHNVTSAFICRRWLEEYVEPGAQVLDFGCGTGLWLNLFVGYGYHGVDQNHDMIEGAKTRLPQFADRFTLVPWFKLPFTDASFDMVWTAAVTQHNKHPAKAEILKEFARVLKPGGYYIFTETTFRPDNYMTTFKTTPEWHENLTDGYSFTWMGWEHFVKPYGFELVKYAPPSEYMFRRT